MNFLKRALTSISRRPGKSIVLLLLVFILGTVISGALVVEVAIMNTEVHLRRNMRPIVILDNREAINDHWMGLGEWPTPLSLELLNQISQLSYVSHFNYYFSVAVSSFDLTPYEPEHFMGNPVVYPSDLSSFDLRGTSNPELWDVTEEVIEMVDGRMFTENEINENIHTAIVSKRFAMENNLIIGSTFQMSSFVFDFSDGWNNSQENILEQMDHEFEIIGMFDVIRQDESNMRTDQERHQEWNRVNNIHGRIYVPNTVARDVENNFYQMIRDSGMTELWAFWMNDAREEAEASTMFALYDPLDLNSFRATVEPMLPDGWQIMDLSETFANMSSSMQTLQDIANWILFGAIGSSLLVLSLLIILFLRDRRYEFGVYLALGEKRLKIIGQVMLEVISIAVISISLALFAGNIISNNLSRSMLLTELSNISDNLPPHAMFADGNSIIMRWGGLGVREMTPAEMLEAFDIPLEISTIFIFYVIGLTVVMLSTGLSTMYIFRLNPKKVLMSADKI